MKNLYRGIGIGLLIVNIFSLFPFLGGIVALISLPTFGETLMSIIPSLYEKILFFAFTLLWLILGLWGVILSINLIKKNKYSRKLFLWVITFGGMEILSFILYLPVWIISLKEAGQLSLIFHFPLATYWNELKDLITGVLVYIFLIFHDNKFSRIVKGKIR